MKKLIAIILCIGLCLGLCGCSVPADASSLPRMVRVVYNHPSNMSIFVDTETRVMYALYSSSNGATMTVMIDAEGKPLLWEGELK